MVKTDLWGNEIEESSSQDNWNAVMEKLNTLYQLHCTAERIGANLGDLIDTVDELCAAYNKWLD